MLTRQGWTDRLLPASRQGGIPAGGVAEVPLVAMTRTRSNVILTTVRRIVRNRRPLVLLSVMAVLAVAATPSATPAGSSPHPAT